MPNWYPGLNAQGLKPFGEVVGLARGFWSQPPAVTTPGTTASGTAVANSTGFDVMVYASATTGITRAVVNGTGTVTAGGSIVPAGVMAAYLPAQQTIAITYTGTLTWTWLAV